MLPVKVQEEVAKVFGQKIQYPSDCERLSMSIREKLNETIGITTLKRLFGFVSDVQEPRTVTLDILARYCGFQNYTQMLKTLTGRGDSDFEEAPDIESSTLPVGAKVVFEYLPDRRVELLYVGDLNFKVTESEKGSLRKDDILTISCFNRNQPLVVSNVKRGEQDLGRYVAGKVSGLTALYLKEPFKSRL